MFLDVLYLNPSFQQETRNEKHETAQINRQDLFERKLIDFSMHNAKPQGREEGHYDHSRVAGRHLWAVVMMAEDLVFAARLVMVVGMA